MRAYITIRLSITLSRVLGTVKSLVVWAIGSLIVNLKYFLFNIYLWAIGLQSKRPGLSPGLGSLTIERRRSAPLFDAGARCLLVLELLEAFGELLDGLVELTDVEVSGLEFFEDTHLV